MKFNEISWSSLFRDLLGSSNLRITLFLSTVTYAGLIQIGTGPLFSLLILAPSTYFVSLIFFFTIEELLVPFYKWLTGKNS